MDWRGALGAAGVEQEIVKVPQHKGAVAFVRPQAVVGVGLEKDLAVDQQSEKLEPRKTRWRTKVFDLLRRDQQSQSSRDLRIADFEQGAGARRFQNQFVGAPPQIGKAREDELIGIAQLRQRGQ